LRFVISRRKKEEGRRKKEEGRMKKEEGRMKKEECLEPLVFDSSVFYV
jgi:hypothetical protein